MLTLKLYASLTLQFDLHPLKYSEEANCDEVEANCDEVEANCNRNYYQLSLQTW